MLEDELRKTFEELGIQPVPRTFGALDVVHRGRQVKARRRTATVVGSGLGTAALVGAVALTLAFNGQRSEPVGPAGPSGAEVTTTAPQVTPAPETSVQTSPGTPFSGSPTTTIQPSPGSIPSTTPLNSIPTSAGDGPVVTSTS
ncbi:hypothetical protein JOF41_003908 [Saccharothrix coeruleofusca]|uniref:hypothetical protein n=1 Tax=Saccharothrix coeruleofusca TaxID=33919 RepID=UPI001AE6A84D|nr:hypothetical protein [Saccharothrix coeruleofusca]MBP2337730.1 hypothetical protein [Saccharothrix coeruleofusca]